MRLIIRRLFTLLALIPQIAVVEGIAAGNVDARLDASPAAIGSLAPNLARIERGTVVLSWLEPLDEGYALRYSRWSDDGWAVPSTIASGTNWFINWADFPSVVPINETFWVAHWLVRRPAGGYAYDVHVAYSNDGGGSWSSGMPLHDDGTDSEHGFVTIYPEKDGAGIVWLDGRNTIRENGGMTLRSATLTPAGKLQDASEVDSLTCDCCQTDAINADGNVLIAYRDRTADEVRDVYVSQRTNDAWTPGAVVAADDWVIGGCPVNGPTLATAGNSTAIAWFTAANDVPRVRVSWSADHGETFAAPVDVVTGGTLGRVGIALLPEGAAVVSAVTRESGQSAQLALTRVDINGQRHAPYIVADGVHPFSVPQLLLHDGALLTAWTVREERQDPDPHPAHSAQHAGRDGRKVNPQTVNLQTVSRKTASPKTAR